MILLLIKSDPVQDKAAVVLLRPNFLFQMKWKTENLL